MFSFQSRADSVSVSPGLDKRRKISCYEAGMNHPFAYINVVTEPRLLITSVLVYVLSLSVVDQRILALNYAPINVMPAGDGGGREGGHGVEI